MLLISKISQNIILHTYAYTYTLHTYLETATLTHSYLHPHAHKHTFAHHKWTKGTCEHAYTYIDYVKLSKINAHTNSSTGYSSFYNWVPIRCLKSVRINISTNKDSIICIWFYIFLDWNYNGDLV